MAAREFQGFAAFFFVLGIILLAVAAAAWAFAEKETQILAAGVLIGLGLLIGLCFVASAIVYSADQKPRSPRSDN